MATFNETNKETESLLLLAERLHIVTTILQRLVEALSPEQRREFYQKIGAVQKRKKEVL